MRKMRVGRFVVFLYLAATLLNTAAPGRADDLDDEHCAHCLRAFDEKPLEPASHIREAEIYRVIYLPSFFPQVAMTVEVWPSGTGRMTTRTIPRYCTTRNQSITEERYSL